MTSWWRLLTGRGKKTVPLTWQDQVIQDPWFEAHFHYAADVVAEWLGDAGRLGPVLDFGCGDGITLLGLKLRHGYASALGVDISTTHQKLEKLAEREIELNRLPDELRFQQIKAGERLTHASPFGAIISWSTFEHIDRRYLSNIVSNIYDLLSPGGLAFIQINPLYYSPKGSHLGRFNLPDWAHLLWSKDEVLNWVMAYKEDIPLDEIEENYHKRSFADYKKWVLDEYEQLNQITIDELRQLFIGQGFELVREQVGRVAQVPPNELREKFPDEDLVADEVRFLFRRAANMDLG